LAKSAGKLLGAYHYGAGKSATAEAQYFVKCIGNRVKECVLALDWEGGMNPAFGKNDVDWCKKFLDHVKEKTGVTPFIYMSKINGCRAHNWSAVARDYPLWGAQYGSNSHTGYQTNPWTDSGSWGAWDKVTIFQYSSHGRLSGWNANLDVDLAYMNAKEWSEWATGKPAPVEFPDKTDADLAVEILFNVHGTGESRKKALGGRYTGAQEDVNRLLNGNKTSLLMAVHSYLKRHGADNIL